MNATISALWNFFQRMKRLYCYTRLKNSLNISTIYINYQQRVIAVYINYGSRLSPRCASMFHGCITSSDMKYLLRHVPVTLISPINRCNFLLLPWKIAGKYDLSAGCRRQLAAILNPVGMPKNTFFQGHPLGTFCWMKNKRNLLFR